MVADAIVDLHPWLRNYSQRQKQDKARADKLAEVEAKTAGDTLGDVEDEALVDTIADTLPKVLAYNISDTLGYLEP